MSEWYRDQEGSFLGLGYHHDSTSAAAAAANDNHQNSTDIDQLMNHYMQQCLEFHHEQQSKRQGAAAGGVEELPQFVPASAAVIKQEEFDPSDSNVGLSSDSKARLSRDEAEIVPASSAAVTIKQEDDDHPSSSWDELAFSSESMDMPSREAPVGVVKEEDVLDSAHAESLGNNNNEQVIQAARARAKAVLERFQRQQEQFLQPSVESSSQSSLTGRLSTSHFAAQRATAFQREQARMNKFLEKNFAYAARKERERLDQLSQQVEQAQQWNVEYQALLEQQQRSRYEKRRIAIAQQNARGGIGTAGQKAIAGAAASVTVSDKSIDRAKEKKRSLPSSSVTVAVYVSGFPTDGSVDSEFIWSLFSSCGRIRKVHIYRDKLNGCLKGDGLVIFEVSSTEDQGLFLRNVCQQLNGAELACGSRLRVEPSQSNKSYSAVPEGSSHGSSDIYGPPVTSVGAQVDVLSAPEDKEEQLGRSEAKSEFEDDEDLDDFFSSL